MGWLKCLLIVAITLGIGVLGDTRQSKYSAHQWLGTTVVAQASQVADCGQDLETAVLPTKHAVRKPVRGKTSIRRYEAVNLTKVVVAYQQGIVISTTGRVHAHGHVHAVPAR